MSDAASTAPESAARVTGVPRHPSTTTETTAPALAPRVMPSTSGLASGLRSITWKAAPAAPKAAPASTAITARGNVDSRSTNDAPGTCSPPRMRTASGSETR